MRWFIPGFLLLTLTACQATQPTGTSEAQASNATTTPSETATATPKKSLQERAREYWSLRQREAPEPLYDFLVPDRRKDNTAADYVAWYEENEPFVIREYELGTVQSEDNLGWVEVKYKSSLRKYPKLPPRTAKMWQKWQRIDNTWYPAPPTDRDKLPAAPAVRDRAGEESLRNAFEQAWAFRQNADWAGLYTMVDPRDQSAIPQDEFVQVHDDMAVRYLDRDIKWIEVIDDIGRIRMELVTTLDDPTVSKIGEKRYMADERWVRVDGKWFLDVALERR